MRKIISFSGITSVLSIFVFCAYAQLPASPWVPQEPTPNDGYFGENIADATGGDIKDAPIYASNSGGGEILPVDPWARIRDRSGVRTWRGSGQQGKLNYIGDGTGFSNGDMEQLAPEVNRHNMIVMLDHLRKLGYKIPKSYDDKVKNMPASYRAKLVDSIEESQNASDPFSKVFTGMMNTIENSTGLSMDNILLNTMDLLSTD